MKCFPKNHQNTSKNIPIFTQGQFRPRFLSLSQNQKQPSPDLDKGFNTISSFIW